jgi:hypothetical protein
MGISDLRIGYVPMSNTLQSPGDRRRFVAYARSRKLTFELARPEERYDLVVLSQMADISVWCDYPHGKIVFDFIDSHLATPDDNYKNALRGVVWYAMGRFRRLRFNYLAVLQDMCRRSDAVVCSTEEQRKDISAYCQNVHIVLDVHSTVVQKVKENYHCGEPFNLVWEGLASNITQLAEIRDVLQNLNVQRSVILNLITDPSQARFLGRFGRVESIDLAKKIFNPVRFYIWNEETCSDIIRKCDLAIIPLDLTNPLAIGKPENKLLLFWRMGMPVVASATPAYLRAMKASGAHGLACRDQKEWQSAIGRMMEDEIFRRDMGMLGKDYVENFFSEESLLRRWDNVFSSLGLSLV